MPVKSKVEILQNFVAFSEYMNFKTIFSALYVNPDWDISKEFICFFKPQVLLVSPTYTLGPSINYVVWKSAIFDPHPTETT